MDTHLFDMLDLLGFLCRVSLGVATLGLPFVGLVLVLRATILQEDDCVKWNFLRAIGNAEKQEHYPRPHNERIQNVNDQTQRGDIS